MAKLRIGSIEMWEVSPQSGEAAPQGIKIGHRMTKEHTGRAPYSKKVRAYISENRTIYADETLEVAAHPLFFEFLDDVSNNILGYDSTVFTTRIETNVARFAIKPTDAMDSSGITLMTYEPYTVSQGSEGLQVGTFRSGVGLEQAVTTYLKVQIPKNDGKQVAYRAFRIYIEEIVDDVPSWRDIGSITIKHSSVVEDAGLVFNPSKSEIEDKKLKREGESLTVTVTSDKAYSIAGAPSFPNWLSVSKTTGDAGTQDVTFAASAQAVGSAERIAIIGFYSTENKQLLGSFYLTQEAGEPYAISWEQSKLTFAYDETRIIENTLHANAAWQLEPSDD